MPADSGSAGVDGIALGLSQNLGQQSALTKESFVNVAAYLIANRILLYHDNARNLLPEQW